MAIFTRFLPGQKAAPRSEAVEDAANWQRPTSLFRPAPIGVRPRRAAHVHVRARDGERRAREPVPEDGRAGLHDVRLLPPRAPGRAAAELRLRARLPARRRRHRQRGRAQPAAALLQLARFGRARDRLPGARDGDPARAVLAQVRARPGVAAQVDRRLRRADGVRHARRRRVAGLDDDLQRRHGVHPRPGDGDDRHRCAWRLDHLPHGAGRAEDAPTPGEVEDAGADVRRGEDPAAGRRGARRGRRRSSSASAPGMVAAGRHGRAGRRHGVHR